MLIHRGNDTKDSSPENNVRFEGIIKTWNDERGFGFIEPRHGGQEIFVHAKSFSRRDGARPQLNQAVSFELELGPRGKKRAKNVEPIRSARRAPAPCRESPAQWGIATLFAIPLFLVLYLAVGILWKPSPQVGLLYVGSSVVAFLMYAIDKSAAQRSAWRISESTLHMIAFIGGWPGALLAQQLFRHKSRKVEFRTVFWGTVALNVAIFVVLSSPPGRVLWPMP